MKNIRWILLLIVLLVIISSLLFFKAKSKNQQTPYNLFTITRSDITFSVSADGIVEPNLEVEIKSRASGEIISFSYETGDVVKKGDLLVRLDPIDEQRNVGKKEATLRADKARMAKAMANLKDAESKLERQKELFKRGMVSKEELETSRTTYLQAKAEVQSAEAQVAFSKVALDDAKRRLADTEIRAPMDGTILTKDVEEGQIITSTIDIVGGGTKLMTLADLSRIFLVASVDETDIGKVKLGQEASVTVDAYPKKTFHGKVTHIAPKGIMEENVVTFEVKIEIEDEEKRLLRPVMTANVEITYLQRKNILWLPNEALVDVSQYNKTVSSDQRGVFKVNGKPKLTLVTCGVTDGIVTEILGGLTDGDKIVRHAAFVEQAEAGDRSEAGVRRFMRRVGR